MSILIRKCNFEDEFEVLQLWKRNNLILDLPDKSWKEIWLKNPTYTKEWPIGWVLESKNKIVGSICNVPLTYYYKGNKIITAAAKGFVVDAEARSFSIKLAASFFNQKKVDFFISTTLNKSSSSVFKIFNCHPLNNENYKSMLVCIINTKYAIKSKLINQLGFNNFFTNVINFFLSPLLFIFLKFLGHGSNNNKTQWNGQVKIIPTIKINKDFDTLWLKIYDKSFELLADKSSKAIRWHLSHKSKLKNKNKILAAYVNAELDGYLLLNKVSIPGTSFKRYLIKDIVVVNNASNIIDALLSKAFDVAKDEKVHSIVMIGMNKKIRESFMSFKPFKRRLDYMPVWFNTNLFKLKQALLNSRVWYPSPYDGDSSI